jgi:two-component system response regulator RegA
MASISPLSRTKRFLLIDDDPTFCDVLSRALEKRGFDTRFSLNAEQALQQVKTWIPDYILVDLCLVDSSGLKIIEGISESGSEARIVVLTGYASVATAIEAIKLGAVHYLTKPADVDDIIEAFERDAGDADQPVTPKPMSTSRLEWEHLQRVLMECDGNISEAARVMSMHRRTLQRKLKKYPVRQ